MRPVFSPNPLVLLSHPSLPPHCLIRQFQQYHLLHHIGSSQSSTWEPGRVIRETIMVEQRPEPKPGPREEADEGAVEDDGNDSNGSCSMSETGGCRRNRIDIRPLISWKRYTRKLLRGDGNIGCDRLCCAENICWSGEVSPSHEKCVPDRLGSL